MHGTRFWIGASTKGTLGSAAGGIRPLDVGADGTARLGNAIEVGPNPMWVAIRDPDVLAVAHETAEGAVSLWRIDGDRLHRLGSPAATSAASPCHLAFSDDGALLLAANYGGARLTVHRILTPSRADATAEVSDIADADPTVDFTGDGPHASRQIAPHPHQVVIDRARDRVLVPDLGADRLRVLPMSSLPARLPQYAADDVVIHAGAGPRHLVIVDDTALVANELDRTVSMIDLDTGRELGASSIGDDVAPRGLGCSGIRSTRAGTVLVGDRDADAVRALRFDEHTRTLELVATLATGGRHPRDLQLTHDERWLLVADQASDSVAVVSLDDGVPTRVVTTVSTPAPACLARECSR